MFSTSTISRITEELRFAQEQVTTLEREAAAARASVAEWSNLLSYAETASGQTPAESGDQLVAEQPPAPCFCGMPGTPGTLHDAARCVPIDQTQRPAPTLAFGPGRLDDGAFRDLMGRAQDRVRDAFEPYKPGGIEQPGGQA